MILEELILSIPSLGGQYFTVHSLGANETDLNCDVSVVSCKRSTVVNIKKKKKKKKYIYIYMGQNLLSGHVLPYVALIQRIG